MGYVEAELAAPGTRLTATVRDKPQEIEVVRLPFVAPNYHRG